MTRRPTTLPAADKAPCTTLIVEALGRLAPTFGGDLIRQVEQLRLHPIWLNQSVQVTRTTSAAPLGVVEDIKLKAAENNGAFTRSAHSSVVGRSTRRSEYMISRSDELDHTFAGRFNLPLVSCASLF